MYLIYSLNNTFEYKLIIVSKIILLYKLVQYDIYIIYIVFRFLKILIFLSKNIMHDLTLNILENNGISR